MTVERVHTHVWTLSWFGFHVQESCACGAYRTALYDACDEWEITEPRTTEQQTDGE